MAQNEANVAGVQLEKVRKLVKAAFDTDFTFYGFLEKREVERVSNREARIPIKLRPGGKFKQYNPDGGQFGRGSGPQFDKMLISIIHFAEVVEWTALSDWATDDERKAVLSNFKDNLASALEEMRRNIDSMCMTDGTGVLGTTSAVSAGGGTGGGDRLTFAADGFRARLIRFGIDLNVYNAALSTNRTSGAERAVVFYDPSNNIVDLAAPTIAGLTAGDKVVVSGVTSTPPVSVNGVPYYHNNASTGTLLGLNRATNPEIRANRVAAGGPLALPFARLAANKVGERAGKAKKAKGTWWTHPAQLAAYEELGMSVTVINGMPKGGKLDMYYGGDDDDYRIAGLPVKTSYSWDRTRMDLITDGWFRAEMKSLDFYRVQGRYIFEGRGTDGSVATYNQLIPTLSFNLGLDNPGIAAYIDTLSIPSGY